MDAVAKNGGDMGKRERVDAALSGQDLDRVPVSAWRHFIPEEKTPETLAQASLNHFQKFDWDWLKVNPRATYYAEAFGNTYDYTSYASVFPRSIGGPVEKGADLRRISPVSPTEGVFAEQLRLLGLIKEGIGGARFIQTVFSPLSVLAFIAARSADPHTRESFAQAQPDAIRRLIAENPDGVHQALRAITETLSGYARAVVDAGASGLFFAIVRLARSGVMSSDEYARFGRPYDLEVLKAVEGAPFNLLHVCGQEVHFDLVSDYPVHAVNWAAIGQNNPDIAEARQKTGLALVGGVDETKTLPLGTPDEVESQARSAIRASGGRKFLLTPGCSLALTTPDANLHALRRAADAENAGR